MKQLIPRQNLVVSDLFQRKPQVLCKQQVVVLVIFEFQISVDSRVLQNTLGICFKRPSELLVFVILLDGSMSTSESVCLCPCCPRCLSAFHNTPSSFVPHRIYNNLQKYPRYPCEQVIKMLLLLFLLYCERYSKTILDCFFSSIGTFSKSQATDHLLSKRLRLQAWIFYLSLTSNFSRTLLR